MTSFLYVLLPLLDKTPAPEDVKPGWLGFTVFLALAAAVVFLALSLRKHLGRVKFEETPDGPAAGNGSEPDREK